MKVTSLAPWFGSKRTLAPKIVEQLGAHKAYWEPFCGSCAVLLAKRRCGYESVNDLHADLINLALVVQLPETAEQLYGRCYRTLFHQSLSAEASERLRAPFEPTGDVERAYWYLIKSWFGINGVAGTNSNGAGSFCVRYSAKGGNGATRWRSVAESIPDWHERLIGVQITRNDAFTILPKINDAAGTVLYIDSPYLVKGSKYVHDFDGYDHERLAETLRRFKLARVVVSYYADPRLCNLYTGWNMVQCDVAKAMVQSGQRDQSGKTAAPEVLLINGPALCGAVATVLEAGDSSGGLFDAVEE